MSWSNSRPPCAGRFCSGCRGFTSAIPRVAGLFLIGMFYNQFLPGGTGGDIIKSYLLLKETPGKKTGALLAVLFDRMIGLVALITHHRRADRVCATTGSPRRRKHKQLVWGLLVVLGSAVLVLRHDFCHQRFQSYSTNCRRISRCAEN